MSLVSSKRSELQVVITWQADSHHVFSWPWSSLNTYAIGWSINQSPPASTASSLYILTECIVLYTKTCRLCLDLPLTCFVWLSGGQVPALLFQAIRKESCSYYCAPHCPCACLRYSCKVGKEVMATTLPAAEKGIDRENFRRALCPGLTGSLLELGARQLHPPGRPLCMNCSISPPQARPRKLFV